VDERIVESALEMLTPAAKSALRPRVRARWLRTIREARELVAKGAASEHLELEVNDETAAFPLSQRLLAHCARDVRAAVASAAKSAIAAADLQPAVVTHVVCIGGGANLPGVLEAVAQASPGAELIAHPPGADIIAIGCANLALRYAADNPTALRQTRRLLTPPSYRGKSLGLAVLLGGSHDRAAYVVPPADTFPSARRRIDVGVPAAEPHAIIRLVIVSHGQVLCELGRLNISVPTTANPLVLRLCASLDICGVAENPDASAADAAVARAWIEVVHEESGCLWCGQQAGVLPPVL
jgi:hypothetical protein